jgi:hypothetical protein
MVTTKTKILSFDSTQPRKHFVPLLSRVCMYPLAVPLPYPLMVVVLLCPLAVVLLCPLTMPLSPHLLCPLGLLQP